MWSFSSAAAVAPLYWIDGERIKSSIYLTHLIMLCTLTCCWGGSGCLFVSGDRTPYNRVETTGFSPYTEKPSWPNDKKQNTHLNCSTLETCWVELSWDVNVKIHNFAWIFNFFFVLLLLGFCCCHLPVVMFIWLTSFFISSSDRCWLPAFPLTKKKAKVVG